MRSVLFLQCSVVAAAFAWACSDPPPVDSGDDGGDGSGGSDNPGTSSGGGSSSGGSTSGSGGGGGLPGDPPYGHPDPTASYPEYDGFQLFLVEEFEEPLDLDADPIWTWSDGGLSEGLVRFHREGISFADGKMRLTVDEAGNGDASPESCSHAEYSTVFNKPLLSGELRTRYNMFRYGRYETRMRAPSVQPGNTTINGNYIATMFVFRTPKFLNWREIDIEVTGNGPNTVTTNLITANDTFTWNADIQEVESHTVDGLDSRGEFHDYAFEWLPERITWYLDGEVMQERLSTDGGLPIPEMSAKIMMNLWIFNGGGFGGTEGANNQYPMQSEYEWFRFYKWEGDDKYPCAGMNPAACLTEADQVLSSNNPCDGIPHVGQVNGRDACQATCK